MKKILKMVLVSSFLFSFVMLSDMQQMSAAEENEVCDLNNTDDLSRTSRCATCLHAKYVSHKISNERKTYTGTVTKGYSVEMSINVGEGVSIGLGAAYSQSRQYKEYRVVYDLTSTFDYYTAMGQYVNRKTYNFKNQVRYVYVAI